MEATALPWLNAVVGTIESIAIGLLVLVNGCFAAGILVGRHRGFVNRWTRTLVVTDAALLLAALGTPVVALTIKLGVRGLLLVASIPAMLMPQK